MSGVSLHNLCPHECITWTLLGETSPLRGSTLRPPYPTKTLIHLEASLSDKNSNSAFQKLQRLWTSLIRLPESMQKLRSNWVHKASIQKDSICSTTQSNWKHFWSIASEHTLQATKEQKCKYHLWKKRTTHINICQHLREKGKSGPSTLPSCQLSNLVWGICQIQTCCEIYLKEDVSIWSVISKAF